MPKMIDSFRGPYEFLSNFYRCKIRYEGIEYPTLEHAFQACKFSTVMDRERMAACSSPGLARRLGRAAHLPQNWEAIKIEIMHQLLRCKFIQNPDLAERLLATGSMELVESNTWRDQFWGVDIQTRQGQNWLGKLLMVVRKELQHGAAISAFE